MNPTRGTVLGETLRRCAAAIAYVHNSALVSPLIFANSRIRNLTSQSSTKVP